jgi:non-ribosomal peptide synthase protein (TIGR01720 family)
MPDFVFCGFYKTLTLNNITGGNKMSSERKALLLDSATSISTNLIVEEEQKENDLVLPQTEVEQFLTAVWSELLRRPKVGIYDDFFDLGGHSLLATELLAKIYQQFRVELPARKIYESPTVFSLAKEIEAAVQSVQQAGRPGEIRRQRKQKPVTGVVPLTPGQAWYFIHRDEIIEPDRRNISRLLEVDSKFDPDKLKQALTYLWEMHDCLRARFIQRGAQWEQIIDGPEQSSLDYREYNLEDAPVGAEERLIEDYAELLQGSINITNGPLVLTAYLNFGPKRPGRLMLFAHHLVGDANSMTTLVKDLQIVYQQLSAGKPIDLPEKSITIKEWAELLHKYVLSGRHRQTIEYWLGLPWDEVPALPIDYPWNYGKNLYNSSATVTVALTEKETTILSRKVPLVLNLEVDIVLLWALTKVVSEWTGSKMVEIAMDGNGHDQIPDQKYMDLSRTLGWITSERTMVLENVKSNDYFQELSLFYGQIKKIPNNGYGYRLAAALNNDNQVAKLLQKFRKGEISLNYKGLINQVNNESDGFKLVSLSCGSNWNPQSTRFYTFRIFGDINNHCLTIVWEYSSNLCRKETVEKLADKYIRTLKDLIPKLES